MPDARFWQGLGPLTRIIVLDIEIAKPIESCPTGWAGARKGECGVACAILWDSETRRYHLYDQHNLKILPVHLSTADLIVGWNSSAFDIPCLEGYLNDEITGPQYDILKHIWSALGTRFSKGYKLSSVAERTLGLHKTDTGATAPKLAAEGRWAELMDYCLNDVFLTKELFNHIIETGHIIDIDGNKLGLEVPCEEMA